MPPDGPAVVRGRHAQVLHRRAHRARVVVEDAANRLPVVQTRVQLPRVDVQQVVQLDPAAVQDRHQVCRLQLRHPSARLLDRQPREARGRLDRQVRRRVQAEQAEEPGRGRRQGLVRPGVHGPQVGRVVAHRELVELRVARPELSRHRDEVDLPPSGRPGRDQGQSQRQPPAVTGDLVQHRRVVTRPLGPQAAHQELAGVGRGQDVELQAGGRVLYHQAVEAISAGHQDHRARRSRQQGAHLLAVRGVVQDDEQTPTVGQRLVARHSFLCRVRRLRRPFPERDQEMLQRLLGRHDGARAAPSQVEPDLAVDEPVRRSACPPCGEGGLPDTGLARDDDDGGVGRAGPGRPRHERVDPFLLLPAPDEARHVGNLTGHGGCGPRCDDTEDPLVPPRPLVGEDPRVQRPQPRTGFHPQLGDEVPAQPVEGVQGLRPAAGLAQAADEQEPDALPQGVAVAQVLEHGDVRGPARRHQQVVLSLDRRQALFGQPRAFGLQELALHVGQGVLAPLVEGVPERGELVFPPLLPGGRRHAQPAREPADVGLVGGHVEQVAVRAGADELTQRPQCLAQPVDRHVRRLPGVRRRGPAPERVGDLGHRHDEPAPEDEQRQDRP